MRLVAAGGKRLELHWSAGGKVGWPVDGAEVAILSMGSFEVAVDLRECVRRENAELREALRAAGGVEGLIDMRDLGEEQVAAVHDFCDLVQGGLEFTDPSEFESLRGEQRVGTPILQPFESEQQVGAVEMHVAIITQYHASRCGQEWHRVAAAPEEGVVVEHAYLLEGLTSGQLEFSRTELARHKVHGITTQHYVAITSGLEWQKAGKEAPGGRSIVENEGFWARVHGGLMKEEDLSSLNLPAPLSSLCVLCDGEYYVPVETFFQPTDWYRVRFPVSWHASCRGRVSACREDMQCG